jgi:hypothetical protein
VWCGGVTRGVSLTSYCAISDARAASDELQRLRAIDKERERVHNQKLKGMYTDNEPRRLLPSLTPAIGWLSRGGLDTSTPDAVEEISSPGTKEAKSDGAT